MSTMGWRILLLVATASAFPDPSPSRAQGRGRRQVDTSHLSNNELVCQLAASLNGGDASQCNNEQPPPTNPDAEPVPGGCTCVPAFQCKDNNIPGANSDSFLVQINVRTGSLCPKVEDVCCNDFDTTMEPLIAKPFSPSCGRRNIDGIINNFVGFKDHQSQFGEFPWMAAVMTAQQINEQPLYICGASLIHSQVVLTVAHHIHDRTPTDLVVRLGEWNFKEPSESISHQDLRVTEILIHPNYVRSTLAYDVALLILDQHAKLGHTVDTICLPPPNYDFAGHKCVVSGWGKDIFSELGKYQQILKSIELPAVSHASCERAMRGTRLGPGFHLHDSFMCAGGRAGEDACKGDGGSPLVCHKPNDPSKYYQAGVVSWGIGCGEDGVPGVYADVSKAVPWIQSIIDSKFGHDVRTGFD